MAARARGRRPCGPGRRSRSARNPASSGKGTPGIGVDGSDVVDGSPHRHRRRSAVVASDAGVDVPSASITPPSRAIPCGSPSALGVTGRERTRQAPRRAIAAGGAELPAASHPRMRTVGRGEGDVGPVRRPEQAGEPLHPAVVPGVGVGRGEGHVDSHRGGHRRRRRQGDATGDCAIPGHAAEQHVLLQMGGVAVGGPGVDGEADAPLDLREHLEGHVERIAGVVVDAEPGVLGEGDVVEAAARRRGWPAATMPSASREASRTVGGSSSGRLLATVSCSGATGHHPVGRPTESVAVEVSRSTWNDWVLVCPSVSTPMKLSWSWPTPPSARPLATRVQRVKSTTPV